jgi:hypothetical protein
MSGGIVFGKLEVRTHDLATSAFIGFGVNQICTQINYQKRAVKNSVACKRNASMADKLFYLCWYFGKGRYGYSDIRVCEL